MTDLHGMAPRNRLQLWGGVECTIVRVGDEFRDQSEETGHRRRASDIDRIADLGVTTVRYPILWETIAPDRPDKCDFAWTDERLAMLRERGISVVGGLLHHGSGPRYTNLLDPDFVPKFADFAARVAERYPWIDLWTPVNEPLTTARFSGLYGHWYPHRGDYRSMIRALMNECLGTAAAIKVIRAANPGAKLLQTEDLGKTFSTAPLRYQARHENERRWLSFDLLAGRVDERHCWHRVLRDHGITEAEIAAFSDGAAKPDLLGINHYLTSERFLDHRTKNYPGLHCGGNRRHRYADVEAVRVKRLAGVTGIGPRLREAWTRYGIPIVISEVHHGCTRDEQLRWFAEVWHAAEAERQAGVDVRAVTLWSLFGNVDWRSLLTRREGIYDVGAFDTRSAEPRPTVIVEAAKAFASGKEFDHPVLDAPGWWKRPERLYPWQGACKRLRTGGRPLLITGATGTLGRAFARICEHRGLPFCLTARADLDITNKDSIARAMERYRPWAVINTAGFVRVADADRQAEACLRENARGAHMLALASASAGIQLLTFSSDLVFDGTLGRRYVESDPVAPQGTYGRSKTEAEQSVLPACGRALVVRTSAFFGPWDEHNFAWNVLASLRRGEPVRASRKERVSPTFVPDLCHASLDLLIDGETGIWHLANDGEVSWHEFARRIAAGAGYEPSMVLPIDSGEERSWALTSERGVLLRPLEQAMESYLFDIGELRPEPEFTIAAE